MVRPSHGEGESEDDFSRIPRWGILRVFMPKTRVKFCLQKNYVLQ